MKKYSISMLILVLFASLNSAQAAQNAYLQLEGETQGDHSTLEPISEFIVVQPDPIGDEVGGDGEDIGTPSADPSADPHKGEIDIESTSMSDGDPDQPIITGQVPSSGNPGTAEIDFVEVGGGGDSGIPGVKPDEIDFKAMDETTDNAPAGSKVAPSQTKVLILPPARGESETGTDEQGEFWFTSFDTTYVRAGFVKLGDIKGESSDEGNKGGNAETTWKVEKGEKATAKKPKEIVVVGSKTADKSSPKLLEAVCKGQFATCDPKDAVTPETLTDFAQRAANTYDSVNEIRFDDSNVTVVGTQPFKLFGFIPMKLKQTTNVSVDPESFGRVKVKLPWYHNLGRKTVRPHDFMIGLEKNIANLEMSKWEVQEFDATNGETETGFTGEEMMTDETTKVEKVVPSEQLALNYSEVKAQLIDTMSKLLAQYTETDFNFLQK